MGSHREGFRTTRKRHLVEGNAGFACVCVLLYHCTPRGSWQAPRDAVWFLSWEEQKEAGGGFSSFHSISLAVGIREKVIIVGG